MNRKFHIHYLWVILMTIFLSDSLAAECKSKPPKKAKRCDRCCARVEDKYRPWIIAGGITLGGLAALGISKAIWPITENHGCSSVTPTPTPTPTPTVGPETLNFAFASTVTLGSNAIWTGQVTTPTGVTSSTGQFVQTTAPTNPTIVIGPPSPIGTYTISFVVNSNTNPSFPTELGTVTETNQLTGSTQTFTTPLAPNSTFPNGYITGSTVTFQFTYNPSVNP